MSKIEIEIVDDNEFNRGWLLYLLGQDRPDEEANVAGANGWDMGLQTGALKAVRHVFTRQSDIDRPQYVVREVLPDKVMTNASKYPKIADATKGDFTMEAAADGQKVITPHDAGH